MRKDEELCGKPLLVRQVSRDRDYSKPAYCARRKGHKGWCLHPDTLAWNAKKVRQRRAWYGRETYEKLYCC